MVMINNYFKKLKDEKLLNFLHSSLGIGRKMEIDECVDED